MQPDVGTFGAPLPTMPPLLYNADSGVQVFPGRANSQLMSKKLSGPEPGSATD